MATVTAVLTVDTLDDEATPTPSSTSLSLREALELNAGALAEYQLTNSQLRDVLLSASTLSTRIVAGGHVANQTIDLNGPIEVTRTSLTIGITSIPTTIDLSNATIAYATPGVDENTNGGLFHVDPLVTLTIVNSNLSGGLTASGFGGQIYNAGNLTLIDDHLYDGRAAAGGGIFNVNGTLTITNSSIVGDVAQSGGAIAIIGRDGNAIIGSEFRRQFRHSRARHWSL